MSPAASAPLPAAAVPADREQAEAYILAELASYAAELADIDARRQALYERRADLYSIGRGLEPPVAAARMARAAGVSPAALVLSTRNSKK